MLEKFIQEGIRGYSPATVRTYVFVLEQFNKWLNDSGADMNNFARSDVQQYIDYLVSKRKSAATINKVWSAIKSYCRWCGKDDAVEDLRVIKQPDYKKQAPKSLDKIERLRLIRDVDRNGNLRNYAILMLFLYSGVRLTELQQLNIADITLSERKGLVRVIGKGNKERKIPLGAEVRRALVKYLETRSDNHPALFLSNRRQRISVRSIQHTMERYGFHPHQMRHTFITGLVRAGEDIAVVQSLSGHASADMVLRYAQPTEEDKNRAIEGLYHTANE